MVSEAMLTAEDLDVLVDAVAAWEDKEQASTMMAGIILTQTAKTTEEARESIALLNQAYEAGKADRRDKAILLQAKLLQLRNAYRTAESAERLVNNGR